MLLAQCVCSKGVKLRVHKMVDFHKVNMFKKKREKLQASKKWNMMCKSRQTDARLNASFIKGVKLGVQKLVCLLGQRAGLKETKLCVPKQVDVRRSVFVKGTKPSMSRSYQVFINSIFLLKRFCCCCVVVGFCFGHLSIFLCQLPFISTQRGHNMSL